jgi:hypothetical protein
MHARIRHSTIAIAVVTALVAASAESVAVQPLMRSGRRRLASVATPRGRRGRPRKFNRPARPVTLTLPEDVISALSAVDADLSRAVVRTMQQLAPGEPRPPAELTTYAGNRAVILVPPNKTLRARTGVEFVPQSDGRALLAFDDQLSISKFELHLMDALTDPSLEDGDRALFTALADILKNARRQEGVELRHKNIVVLRWKSTSIDGDDADGETEEPPAVA